MRSVIVTGGSRGLGLAITRRLASAGYRVIAVAREEGAELAGFSREANALQSGRVEFRALDLARLGDIPLFVKRIRSEFGQIHGLVNNAGIGTSGTLAIMPDRNIEQLIAVNALAPAILTKYVARSMMSAGAGRIVNIASIVATSGSSGLSVYAGTKSFMVGFTKSLARELGPLGITVNAIAPGFVMTTMTDSLNVEDREKIAHRSALRRLIEPEDVADAVEYLLNDRSRGVTGVVLTVDAGATA
jgi:3-oxoacyl-[acyl-carrier protein] reductase